MSYGTHKSTGGHPEPWGRQPGETTRAFRAFTLYRDMPSESRSLTKVARLWSETGPQSGLSTVKHWSRQHGWRERVLAWDEEIDRRKRAAVVGASELLVRHELELVRKALDRCDEALDQADLSGMSFGDLVRCTDTLIRLERHVLGADAEALRRPSPPPSPEQNCARGPVSVGRVANVLRVLEDAGAIMLPGTSAEPPLEGGGEDE